jgi:MinD superfamily P-loop ATPase
VGMDKFNSEKVVEDIMNIPFGEIGEIVIIEGSRYLVVESSCEGCDLKNNICENYDLHELKCDITFRDNECGIVYKKVK